MPREELVMVCCSDIAGQTRGKGFPVKLLEARRNRGVGWTGTNIMITSFGAIADGPFGSFGDLFLKPDLDTHVRVDFDNEEEAPEQFVLSDICNTDSSPWDCCPRNFLRRGLAALQAEAGLLLKASFEHEFHYDGVAERPNSGYNLDSYRRQGSFGETLIYALTQAGLEPDTFMPEYGPCQYEITVEPSIGLRAADNAVILRELARAAARRHDARASFTPILRPDAVGNGVHLHFSFLDAETREPVGYDPARPHGISQRMGSFAAGILQKMPALTALTAASTISYIRLVPHRWSAAFNNLGIQDREAGVRRAPVFEASGAAAAEQFNLEYRAGDAAASPYFFLGGLVWAGLHGLRQGLATPDGTDEDPSEMTEAELESRGLVRLPQSLATALDTLAGDEDLKAAMGPLLHQVYLQHKRFENDLLAELSPVEQCEHYHQVY